LQRRVLLLNQNFEMSNLLGIIVREHHLLQKSRAGVVLISNLHRQNEVAPVAYTENFYGWVFIQW